MEVKIMEPIKIKEILDPTDGIYIIPRYQRNYDWGKKEISQLIKDILEFFDDDSKKSYYLGSLVCFKKEDGKFELIDGQQRHTTITLINLVLKNENINGAVSKSNLTFDSRKKAQNYIEKLYEKSNDKRLNEYIAEYNTLETGNFKDAIEIIQEELENRDKSIFADNFYNRVFLFRVEVPEDTDLNHYFEIMNNRGEQLEKHEIVKSLLMEKTGNKQQEKQKKQNDQAKFAAVWDACSDMSNYIYFNFNPTDRKKLFDADGNLKISNFSELTIDNDSFNENDTLEDIINKNDTTDYLPKFEEFTREKYKSIIDFPNFLLQILKLKYTGDSLDDKKLLEQFRKKNPNPEEFIFDLLKYRTIFDRFVIKQDLSVDDDKKQIWGIRKLNDSFDNTIKTFGKDEEYEEYEDDGELIKLQLILYYSDSANTNNKWLHEILKLEDNKLNTISTYQDEVWKIVKKRFEENKQFSYPHISIFTFYFIEFLLCKLYNDIIKREGNIISADEDVSEIENLINIILKNKQLFYNFRFKSLSSREHLAAIRNISSQQFIDEEALNSIGNLCLISSFQNSAGNKESPQEKKIRFAGDNISLKRIIMFESFVDNKWETAQIKKHEYEIKKLIDFYL